MVRPVCPQAGQAGRLGIRGGDGAHHRAGGGESSKRAIAGGRMARRPPGTEQEYREVLKLLESGHSQPAIGDITGIPKGTVGKWATELLHAGVWNSAEKTVDWSAFETWVLQKFRSDRRRPKTTKAHARPTIGPRKAHDLTVKQVEALSELADWWTGRKAQGATIDSLELQPTDDPRKAHDAGDT